MGVVYITFAARILSVVEMGVVAALGMTSTLFITFGTLAIPSAALKYISESVGSGRPDIAKGIYRKVLRFGLLISGLSSFLCLFGSTVISVVLLGGSAYVPLVWVLAVDVFALLLSTFYDASLKGLQKFRETSMVGAVQMCIRYFFSLFLLITGLGLMGVIIGWVIGDFVGLGLLLFIASVSFKGIHGSETRAYPFIQLGKYSAPLYASAILSYLSRTIDRYILLFFAGLLPLGIYSVAMTVASPIGIVSRALTGPLMPYYSERYGQHGKEALKEASLRTSRYIFLIYVPLAVGLAAISYPLIVLFFGPEYAPGWLPMAIVLVASALTSMSFVVNNLLMSLAATQKLFVANVLGIVVTLPFLAIIVGPLGIVGVALARALLAFTLFTYTVYILKGSLGLHFDQDAFKKAWISSAAMVIPVVLMQILWIHTYMLPLYVLIGGFIYLLMLRLLNAINHQDIEVFNQLIPKRLHKLVEIFEVVYGVGKS